MSLFFSFINESNDIFKQRELSYHLNSFDINNRIDLLWELAVILFGEKISLMTAGSVALITADASMVALG